jgi:hypothetical protein
MPPIIRMIRMISIRMIWLVMGVIDIYIFMNVDIPVYIYILVNVYIFMYSYIPMNVSHRGTIKIVVAKIAGTAIDGGPGSFYRPVYDCRSRGAAGWRGGSARSGPAGRRSGRPAETGGGPASSATTEIGMAKPLGEPLIRQTHGNHNERKYGKKETDF